MKSKFPKFFSKEIKKTEIKYNIKALINRLKYLNKKVIIKDNFQPDEKPSKLDYTKDKNDFVELFHEEENQNNDFFQKRLLNSIKNNIYTKYTSKKLNDIDKNSNVYENLIKEIITTNRNNEDNKDEKKSDIDVCKQDFYKYYKIHREKMEKYKKMELTHKFKQSYSTIYSPHYDYIHKRVITGPKWQKISTEKKMNKTTLSLKTNLKKYFMKENDLSNQKYRTQKNFAKFNINHNIKNVNKRQNSAKNISINNIIQIPNVLNNIKNKRKIINTSKAQKHLEKSNKSKSISYTNKSMEDKSFIKKLNQYIINANNKTSINYDFTRERVKMMVHYKPDKSNIKRLKEFKGCENGEFIDTVKSFKNLKGNKNNGINFGKMYSRPSDKLIPSFLMGMHSRIGIDKNINGFNKLNNYSAERFTKINDLFIPRSFNKYINLSLLQSQYIQPEDIYNFSEFKYLANKILPELKNEFYKNKKFSAL